MGKTIKLYLVKFPILMLTVSALLACGNAAELGKPADQAKIKQLSLSPSDVDLGVGETKQLKLSAVYTDNTVHSVTDEVKWVSSDNSVATISDLGVVSAIKIGPATISAIQGDFSTTARISVVESKSQVSPVSLTITPAPANLPLGLSHQLSAILTMSDESTRDVTATSTWTTTTGAVLVNKGLVTASELGPATVTASKDGFSQGEDITVTPAVVVSMTVSPSSSTLQLGRTLNVAATQNMSNGGTRDVTATAQWTLSKSGVVSVNKGLVTPIAVGVVDVTATQDGVGAYARISVLPVLQSLAITPSPLSLALTKTQQLTVTGTFSDASTRDVTKDVTWHVDAGTVAKVSQDGIVTSLDIGSANISASYLGLTAIASVAVTSTIQLPKTGQTTCYSSTGAVISCATTGQDAFYSAGVSVATRFASTATDCITDSLTGLLWVKDPTTITTTVTNTTATYDWQAALEFVKSLNTAASPLCGYTDWRLPNRKELLSLVNFGQADQSAWLNGQGFANVKSSRYWSSSTYAIPFYPDYAWAVDFKVGNVLYVMEPTSPSTKKTTKYSVWPVRGGQ